jgi:hypothetical protein
MLRPDPAFGINGRYSSGCNLASSNRAVLFIG